MRPVREAMSVQTFTDMLGATILVVEGAKRGSDVMRLCADDGRAFVFEHDQDCCEQVAIEDVVGDVADLLGSPLVLAEEISSEGEPPPDCADSFTWTFYRFATAKGTVTVRWLGESSGYYSEDVDMREERPVAQSGGVKP